MKKILVRDVMTPIEGFHRVSVNASLIEAIQALEDAHDDLLAGKTKQRVVVVEDEKGQAIGKVSPSDIICGLEPGYKDIISLSKYSRAHEADYAINTMRYRALLWSSPLEDICATVKDVTVRKFFKPSTEGQTVQAGDTLDMALHRFFLGRHDSLFVVEQGKQVGLLLFDKVFREISSLVKQCVI